jgi:hypothetical protein
VVNNPQYNRDKKFLNRREHQLKNLLREEVVVMRKKVEMVKRLEKMQP